MRSNEELRNVQIARSRNARIGNFNEAMAKIFQDANAQLKKSADLTDVKTFVSSCLVYMQHARDRRAVRDMLMFVGRVLGHDKRTINIEQPETYRDTLLALQAELGQVRQGPVVDVQAEVKVIGDGSQAQA